MNRIKWIISHLWKCIGLLHSVKGTAGTLGLGGLMHLSQQLLEKLDENHEFNWQQQDLQDFLFQLIELTYQYEHFDERVEQEENVRNHDSSSYSDY